MTRIIHGGEQGLGMAVQMGMVAHEDGPVGLLLKHDRFEVAPVGQVGAELQVARSGREGGEGVLEVLGAACCAVVVVAGGNCAAAPFGGVREGGEDEAGEGRELLGGV